MSQPYPTQKPPKNNDGDGVSLKEILREDRGDCTPCRIIGSFAFMGLGGYTYFSGMTQLAAKEVEIARSSTKFGIGVRRLGIQGIAASMFGLGVYRLFFT